MFAAWWLVVVASTAAACAGVAPALTALIGCCSGALLLLRLSVLYACMLRFHTWCQRVLFAVLLALGPAAVPAAGDR